MRPIILLACPIVLLMRGYLTRKLPKKSSQIIGEEIGTSGKKVEMCRAILDYASQKIKEQVIAGVACTVNSGHTIYAIFFKLAYHNCA
jgi:hypothetical protein